MVICRWPLNHCHQSDQQRIMFSASEIKGDGVSSVPKDVRTGTHVKNQLFLWDSLLECRIKMHKVLLCSNQLPRQESFHGLASTEVAKKAAVSLTKLANCMFRLEDQLQGASTSMFKGCMVGPSNKGDDSTIDDMDEEISSDFEDEVDAKSRLNDGENEIDDDDDGQDEEEDISEEDGEDNEDEDGDGDMDEDEPVKVKETPHKFVPMSELNEELEKRFISLKPIRDHVLDDTFNKTRYSTVGGAGALKGMESFEQNPVKQIDNIMGDQRRVIKRTQLKRSEYRIIGVKRTSDGTTKDDKDEDSIFNSQDLFESNIKKNRKDKDYDQEVFDDDDFYHQLLRELIEAKTIHGSGDGQDPDSLSLSLKWLEIQKMRTRLKRKVDTKASKGRKIRFDVHKELVNFMPSIPSFEYTDEAKNHLFSSLFQ